MSIILVKNHEEKGFLLFRGTNKRSTRRIGIKHTDNYILHANKTYDDVSFVKKNEVRQMEETFFLLIFITIRKGIK